MDLNWISSSDDDSFVRDLGQRTSGETTNTSNLAEPIAASKDTRHDPLDDTRAKSKGSRSLLRLVLLSSPTREPADRILTTQPSSSQKRTKAMEQTIPLNVSDPIEGSSPQSSPQKRQKSVASQDPKKSKIDGYTTKEWNAVNKALRSKAEIMAEMVVEVALCVHSKVKTAYFEERFENLTVRDTFEELPLVSWKRRVKALYDREKDIFVPCNLAEINESFYCLIYDGSELTHKIRNGTVVEDLEKLKKRARFEDPSSSPHIVILTPGFQEYVNKLKSAEQREYQRNLREKLDGTVSNKKRKRAETADILAEEAQRLKVETELKLGININVCKDMSEVIDWLYTFTYTVGSSLYDKRERNGGYANFGRVKLGKDKTSTFILMLQNFNLVTAQKAQHIFQFYASPLSLYNRFMEDRTLGNYTTNNELKPIVSTTVNTAMSRVFSSDDPNQVITD